jgi:hypothetical protein
MSHGNDTNTLSKKAISLEAHHRAHITTTMTAASNDENDREEENAKGSPPVRVYVRIRPLIEEEKGHKSMNYRIIHNHRSSSAALHVQLPAKKQPDMNPAFTGGDIPPPLLRRRDNNWKVFEGITGVLERDATNEQVYQQTLRPALRHKPRSLCVFTYGHTGSGKSHTLLGYDGQGSLGVYKYAIRDLFDPFESSTNQVDAPRQCVLLCIIELYNQKVRDLLTGDECTIREDRQRVVRVRGPFVEDSEGRLEQRFLGQVCHSAQEVIDITDKACAARRVGTSTHHDQSSRSHLLLEIEVVTPQLMEQRYLCRKQETHLTRLKWLQTEKSFGKHASRELPKWTESYLKHHSKLRNEIKEYGHLVKESSATLAKMETDSGNAIVFCDLAGNEYARDAAASTKEEMEEASEINKSLLAVKELMRSLNEPFQKHVSYRDSKLSMLLKRHLERGKGGDSGNTCRAIMMGHLSPSQEHIRKTINTLTYCSMVSNPKAKR